MKKLLVSLIFLFLALTGFAEQDTRYDAGYNLPFNEKAGDVNPQTGNVALAATDLSLPGRAGLDFSFGRVWALNQANVFAMYWNTDAQSNMLSSETTEKHHRMGVGWNTNLPALQWLQYTSSGESVFNLFWGGNVYEIDRTGIDTYNPHQSNLLGYDLLDLRLYAGAKGSEISYGAFTLYSLNDLPGVEDRAGDRSQYVLILKDNAKYYFRPDGKVMRQVDRTGLNSIWYFYNAEQRLCLAVDTVGRKIAFSYDANGNLEKIEWQVQVGKKQADGTRQYAAETRNITYAYAEAADSLVNPRTAALAASGLVSDYRKPYMLTAVTDPEGNITRYSYREGVITFTYNNLRMHTQNAYLLLTDIRNVSTQDGKYRSGRAFEYNPPQGRSYAMFTRDFYSGFMQHYRVSREYSLDRSSRMLNDTRYTYYRNGEANNYNCYTTLVERVKHNDNGTEQIALSALYTYNLVGETAQDHVLNSIVTGTADGFLECRNFVYNPDRIKVLEEVRRQGEFVYQEKYQYDKKTNLKRSEDKAGLVVTRQYDDVYSIPLVECRELTVDGARKTYRSENQINALGQVIRRTLYLAQQDGSLKPVPVARIEYDAYGNAIAQTDAAGNTVHTVYDAATYTFPVKVWQAVTIGAWNDGRDVHTNWLTEPETTQKVHIRSFKVFNTDGTPWMEIDNEGYAVEHYYNRIGIETETVIPDGDDEVSFAQPVVEGNAASDFTDFRIEYLGDHELVDGNFRHYFQHRSNNPGVRITIDYQQDFVKTCTDVDVNSGQVKVTGMQGNGLGNTEQEIEYSAGDIIHAVKQMTYDDFGRMVALTDADAATAFTEIKVNGKTVQKHDKTWLVKYDNLGRQIQVAYPVTRTGSTDNKIITYNDKENSMTTVDPEGRRVYERRDWNGNAVEVIAYGTADTAAEQVQKYVYTYDELKRKLSFMDPKGIVTTYKYDERDLLVEQGYGATGSDKLQYNDRGQLTEKRDRNGNCIRFTYDEMGRNTAVLHYNPAGDFVYKVDTVYDNRGNAVRIDNANLIEHYLYDAANRVLVLERKLKDEATGSRAAEALGITEPVLSFRYSYNDAGMITRMIYPDGGVHVFGYDQSLARLETINEGSGQTAGTPFVTSFSYTPSGTVTEICYANQTVQQWSFDNRKRIAHIGISGPSGTIETLTYKLNSAGDILSINDNEYTYDGFDRITGAKTHIPGRSDDLKLTAKYFGTYRNGSALNGVAYNQAADLFPDGRINGRDHMKASVTDLTLAYDIESFAYDKNGNRTRLMQNGDEYTYEYTGRNQLVRIYKKAKNAGAKRLFTEYAYDANGNTTRRTIYNNAGETTSVLFAYDTMNRLTKTTEGDKTTEYFYDNAGNRFIKKGPDGTTLYLRHGQIAVAMDIELKEAAAGSQEYTARVNRYVLTGELLAGRICKTIMQDGSVVTAKSWYHLDHLNSTKCVTDENGVVEVSYVYRAFGEQLKRLDAAGDATGDSAKYSYGGKELDEVTNLYYFNARYYDAVIGRFINVDPVQDGTNWYVYCHNNPLAMVDPTGLKDKFEKPLGSVIKETIPLTSKEVTGIWRDVNEKFNYSQSIANWISDANDVTGIVSGCDTLKDFAVDKLGPLAEKIFGVASELSTIVDIVGLFLPDKTADLKKHFDAFMDKVWTARDSGQTVDNFRMDVSVSYTYEDAIYPNGYATRIYRRTTETTLLVDIDNKAKDIQLNRKTEIVHPNAAGFLK